MPSSQDRHYEVIVIGAGGVGSAALLHVAARGRRVLGIDRFRPPHDRGSSHGQTRIIRQAYFEHADYVPLLRRTYALWTELERQTGQRLYEPTGLVEVGPPAGAVIQGVLSSAAKYAVDVEPLARDEFRQRFPGLALPNDCSAVFEPAAGYLHVEACVAAHLALAEASGASVLADTLVHGWKSNSTEIAVQTNRGEFTADRLIVTAGPWAAQLLAHCGCRFRPRRKSMFWFACDDPRYQQSAGMPAFYYSLAAGDYYGLPCFDRRGIKIAQHTGGDPVDDPLAVDRDLHTDEQQRVEAFLHHCLPGLSHKLLDHQVCLYTMTRDEHFVVDRYPDDERIVFAAGLSGHGFKFTPVLGEILADLVVSGRTDQPIAFLSLDRPGLRE